MNNRKKICIGVLVLLILLISIGGYLGRFRLAGLYLEMKTGIDVIYIGETEYTTPEGDGMFVLIGTFNFGEVADEDIPDDIAVLNKVMYLLVTTNKYEAVFFYFGKSSEYPSLIHAYVICPDVDLVRSDGHIGKNCKIYSLIIPEFSKEEFIW